MASVEQEKPSAAEESKVESKVQIQPEQLANTVVKEDATLAVRRYFTIPGRDPFDEIEWERRDAFIPGKDKPAFDQKGVEFPKFWSQTATNIVAQKYFRGRMSSPERESSVRQMIGRVVTTTGEWGRKDGYFATEDEAQTFEDELKAILVNQLAAFNSPVWFNVGFEEKPQCSACVPYRGLVSTPEGMVPIGELVDGDQVGREVYDSQGVTRIVATAYNGRKPVYRVNLRNGQWIEATADHVVKAVDERRTALSWLRVDELKPGMRMHLHPHRAKVTERALVAAGGSSGYGDEAPEIDDERKLAVAEAALAGWLQADGFVGHYDHGTNRSLTIEFQTATNDEYEWVIENLDLVFPDAHHNVREVELQDSSLEYRRIRLYGEHLREFVESWGLLSRGTEIRVPARLWTASIEEITAYLRSIFQADGYVTVRRENGCESARVAFAVISEKWCEDVQILLNVIGIYSRRLRKAESHADRHDLHEVEVSIGSERARFAEQVGFVGTDKQGKLLESLSLRDPKRCPDLREEQIVSIELLGAEDVYDIQTESGEFLLQNVAVHNCFILSIEDSMDSILDWIRREGIIFRGGSGSGINLSRLRSSKEQLSKGGYASGPVSFMRGADASAGTIKSGGKTRRAAKMVVLDVDHPDILEFVWCKAREEEKARVLEAAGYDMSLDSPDWSSIQYQNANNSVRVSDSFMHAAEADADWNLTARVDGSVVETMKARDLLHQIADAAWRCADPGVQYDTTINSWHTLPNTGRINASNPCSEYMSIDDSACNLASLNLMKFRREDGELDVEAFEHACDVVFLAQEILVGNSSYPTPEIERNAKAYRQLGLGYANLGALLIARGLPYDSDEGRAYAAAITALMTGRAYRKSAEIASRMGPFAGYHPNAAAMIGVIAKHRAAVGNIAEQETVPSDLLAAARKSWDDALNLGEVHGYRNAQGTVIAPTGTISFQMDCDTTGLEPDFSLVKSKKLVGGGEITIVNKTVPLGLEKLGYAPNEVAEIVAYIDERNTIVGAPYVKSEHYPVFDCAIGDRAIHHSGHVKMMGAIQPFISGALSKTVNLPESTTVDEVARVYLDAWKLGVKAIAIYRDNCKVAQPLSGKSDKAQGTLAPVGGQAAVSPRRRRLPDDRTEIGRKFRVGEYEGYIHVGVFDDGTAGDIFVDIAKEGTTLAGLMNSFMISVSLGLQYGVPLEVYVSKFAHMRFEPSGLTNDPDIRSAKSIVDYVFRWMGKKFLTIDQQEEVGILSPEVRARLSAAYAAGAPELPVLEMPTPGQTALFNTHEDAIECSRCGGRMVRAGTCYTCRDCGTSTGCG
jgi:ribonucleoside-diphosphate reductase alpha chain